MNAVRLQVCVRGYLCESCGQLAAANEIDFKSLFGPSEELLVWRPSRILVEGVLGVQVGAAAAGDARHQQMFFVGHAGLS